MTRHYIVATAGHVDHGKSALVKALTGTDPDRLPEEKARGITIDLGFAHLELPAPRMLEAGFPPLAPRPSGLNPWPSTLSIGIVDVPGHEDFVKNMVAGVGSVDLALFVVAADDGWMPQTEEHLQILTYLGVRRAVVVLTKIDLAQENQAVLSARLDASLRESPFAGAPVVPTSVQTGRGLEELKSTLALVLADLPPPRDIGKPRLPVDRVFSLKGIGTVVTGTLNGGTLARGQAAVIQPGGRTTRVRSLQSHNQDVASAGPGTRTAVNLPDVEVRSESDSTGVARGDVITLAELGAPSRTLDVLLEKSARLVDTQMAAARPMKEGTRVRVHLGTGNQAATVHFPGEIQFLNAGEQRLGRLRFETPVYAFAGDRFILRDWSEQSTLAGGLVLDPEADGRRFRSQIQGGFLQQRAQSPESAAAFVASQLARDGVARRDELLRKSRFGAQEVAVATAELVSLDKLVAVGNLVADPAWWQALHRRAAQAIDEEHRAHPERPGLACNDLRARLAEARLRPDVFDALVADLCRQGFRQNGPTIGRVDHRPALPPQLQASGDRLRTALAAKPFDPPSRKDLAPDMVSQQALRFLLNTGEVVEINAEVVLSVEAYGRVIDLIRTHLRQRGQATVSELRQAIGSSRRVMVPLLERLDREGVTLRQGDVRTLRKA